MYFSYKLPNHLTDYQRHELGKISKSIDGIVGVEESNFELLRRDSMRGNGEDSNYVIDFG